MKIQGLAFYPIIYMKKMDLAQTAGREPGWGKSHAGGTSNPKDVKNEGTSWDVHENTGPRDNMADNQSGVSA
jgi:hypothetical protein